MGRTERRTDSGNELEAAVLRKLKLTPDFLQQPPPESCAESTKYRGHVRRLCEHLSKLGCPPTDVPEYVRFAHQTLASLYLKIQAHGSHLEIRRLALRFALDARASVEGDVRRFFASQDGESWVVREHDQTGDFSTSMASGVVVGWYPATEVLGCVFGQPRRYEDLRELVEQVFGRVPTEADALPAVVTQSIPADPPAPERIGPGLHNHFLKEVRRLGGEWFKAGDLQLGSHNRTSRTNWLSAVSMAEYGYLEHNGRDGNARQYRVRPTSRWASR